MRLCVYEGGLFSTCFIFEIDVKKDFYNRISTNSLSSCAVCHALIWVSYIPCSRWKLFLFARGLVFSPKGGSLFERKRPVPFWTADQNGTGAAMNHCWDVHWSSDLYQWNRSQRFQDVPERPWDLSSFCRKCHGGQSRTQTAACTSVQTFTTWDSWFVHK